MSNEEKFIEALEKINRKLNSSSVLNGGFDKLIANVEHIKEKQEETCEKIEKINENLYDPTEGFFAKVSLIESTRRENEKDLMAHFEADEKFQTTIKETLEESRQQTTDLINTKEKLVEIGGKDLNNFDSLMKTYKNITKILYVIVMFFITATLGLIWEFITKHHN